MLILISNLIFALSVLGMSFLPTLILNDNIMCNLFNDLQPILLNVAIGGAMLAVIYFGAMKILSFIAPQLEGRMRQVPTNIIFGLAAFTIGPWLVTQLATGLGLSTTGC